MHEADPPYRAEGHLRHLAVVKSTGSSDSSSGSGSSSSSDDDDVGRFLIDGPSGMGEDHRHVRVVIRCHQQEGPHLKALIWNFRVR